MSINFPIMPLEYWREQIGYNPWHFWGLADKNIVPVTSKCNDVVHEYSWQGADEAGRSEIRASIMTAEQTLFDYLGYWTSPVYSEKNVPWPRYVDNRLSRSGRTDARGNWMPIQLDEGWIQNIGIEAYTLISAGAAVVYTDEDGDGLFETFTVTQVTSVTNTHELALYFAVADRLDEDSTLSARWRIEPVNVTISAGTATFKGKRWLVVKPSLYEDVDNYPIDPTVAANFITTCDVYRHYTYTEGSNSAVDSQSALIWESRPCCWGCGTPSSTDPASEGWVAGRCGIRNAYNGIVVPAEAVYSLTTLTWSHPSGCFSTCGEPDRVLIRYLAGYPLDSYGHTDRKMRTLVARLAAAEMTRRICACDTANREFYNWQFDVSRVEGPETFQASLDVLDNPLGTRRGHIYAWQQIKSLARVSGILS